MATIYEKACVDAVGLIRQGVNPPEAWERSVGVYTKSESARNKRCPRGAFLGLCEDGLVKYVPTGHYTNSTASKGYAVAAVRLLKEGKAAVDNLPAIRRHVMPMRQNGDQGEIKVAFALWKNCLIRYCVLGTGKPLWVCQDLRHLEISETAQFCSGSAVCERMVRSKKRPRATESPAS